MGQSNSEMNIYWKMIMIYNKNFFFSDTLSFNAINDDRAKTDRQQACDLFWIKKEYWNTSMDIAWYSRDLVRGHSSVLLVDTTA